MRRYQQDLGVMGGLTVLGVALTCAAAWVTHIIWIISKLSSDVGATFGQMALGAIGAFMPPVGVVHGFMLWLGY